MSKILDASQFDPTPDIYEKEFKRILAGITICYQMMINEVFVPANDENKIRDILYNRYLNNNKLRNALKLIHYSFDCEVAEYSKDGELVGYLDYKISTENTFIETEAYYIIECKRLNNKTLTGTSGLNGEYIKNGILRFVIRKYTSFYGLNGMIGFIVESMDIDGNIQNINMLLENDFKHSNTKDKLEPAIFIDNFKFSYSSLHEDIEGNKIKLFHLMFDFSRNIEESH